MYAVTSPIVKDTVASLLEDESKRRGTGSTSNDPMRDGERWGCAWCCVLLCIEVEKDGFPRWEDSCLYEGHGVIFRQAGRDGVEGKRAEG